MGDYLKTLIFISLVGFSSFAYPLYYCEGKAENGIATIRLDYGELTDGLGFRRALANGVGYFRLHTVNRSNYSLYTYNTRLRSDKTNQPSVFGKLEINPNLNSGTWTETKISTGKTEVVKYFVRCN